MSSISSKSSSIHYNSQNHNGTSSSTPHRQVPHSRIDDEELIYKKYELMELLGKGSFGTVFKIRDRETDDKYAIKIMNKERANGKGLSNFENEVVIMKSVTHPYLIKLEEVYETKKKLFLITELCEAGELSKWLKSKGPIREEKSKIIMRKIVEAIIYLHHNNIVHRDLKLENILIKTYEDEVENLEIKITDFGLSSQRETCGTDGMFEEYCGTPLYMAPEIIDNYPYSQLCDVWALGIIMYIILTSQNPFHAENEQKLREQIRKAEINRSSSTYKKLSQEAKDCLERMIKVDPAHRITSSELFSHPWFLDKKCSEMLEPQKNVLELMKEMLIEQDNEANKTSSPNCAISNTSSNINNNASHTNLNNLKFSSKKSHTKMLPTHTQNINGTLPTQINHFNNHNYNNDHQSPRHSLPTSNQSKTASNCNQKYQQNPLKYKKSKSFAIRNAITNVQLPLLINSKTINSNMNFDRSHRNTRSISTISTSSLIRKTYLPILDTSSIHNNKNNNAIRDTQSYLDLIRIKSLHDPKI